MSSPVSTAPPPQRQISGDGRTAEPLAPVGSSSPLRGWTDAAASIASIRTPGRSWRRPAWSASSRRV